MQVETDFRVSSVISPPQEQTRLNDTLKLNMKVGIFTVTFSLSYMLHSNYRKVVILTFKYNFIPKCLIIKQFLEVSKQNWQIMRLLIYDSIYSGVRYHCDLCDYTSKYKADIKKHEQHVHEGKIYNCADCSYTCRSSESLRKHVKSHIKVKHDTPYA